MSDREERGAGTERGTHERARENAGETREEHDGPYLSICAYGVTTAGPAEPFDADEVRRVLAAHREHVERCNRETAAELLEAMRADPSLRPRVLELLWREEMRTAFERPLALPTVTDDEAFDRSARFAARFPIRYGQVEVLSPRERERRAA